MSPHPAALALDRIVAWLREHAPPFADRLSGPATDAALQDLEDRLNGGEHPFGRPVPAELTAVLRRHDGGREAGILPGGPDFDDCPFNLLSAAGIADERTLWATNAAAHPLDADDLAYAAEESDPEVRRTDWDPAWLPFAEVGGNVLCLDFHPADGGTAGQVISLNHENAGLRRLAPSLTDYLEGAADAFEAGRFALEDGKYLVALG